jgi:hypothetical protein
VRRVSIRAFAVAAAVAALALLAASRPGPRPSPPVGKLSVIYVGAEDCAPCRTWGREQRPQFLASPEFARISYREVVAPRLFELLDDGHWPPDLRVLRDTLDRGDGVPLWILSRDDTVVLKARGLSQWAAVALPKIKSLLD